MVKRKREESSESESDSSSSSDEDSDSYSDCDEKKKKKRKIENYEIKKKLVECLCERVLFQISLYRTSYKKKRKSEEYLYFSRNTRNQMFKLVFPDDVGDDFPSYFLKSLKNAKAAGLAKIVKKFFVEKSIKPPRLKTEMMEWIVFIFYRSVDSIYRF